MGWIIINDRGNKLDEVRLGLANIAGRNFGPNSTVQLALPEILKNTSKLFLDEAAKRVGVKQTLIVYTFADLQSFTEPGKHRVRASQRRHRSSPSEAKRSFLHDDRHRSLKAEENPFVP
jgi:hypothetical protein